jgi:curved DNA-binding protein CbpA
MQTPLPALTGTLDSTPLVNLLVYALDHRLSGTLVFEQEDGQKHAVYLDDGSPAKVRLAGGGMFLGELLVELGKITRAAHQSTFEQASADERLYGSVLLERGLLDELALREALREQLSRKLDFIASLSPATVWGFYDRINYLERYGSPESLRAKPLALIWQLVQKHADEARVAEVIGRIGGRVLRLHSDAPVLRFHFGRNEQAVIEVLRAKPQPFSELEARDLVEPARLAELVYMLAVTRQLELGQPDLLPLGSSEPPSSSKVSALPGPPPHGTEMFRSMSPPATRTSPSPTPAVSPTPAPVMSAPPPSGDPEVRAFKAEIEAKLAMHDGSYYALLGLAETATSTEIQENYLRLAKKWHPDRLGPEFDEVREAVTRIFARMSEAQQILSDPAKRRDYDNRDLRAANDAEEAEHVHRVLKAATAFQRAEILLRRNSLAQAEEEARSALADDPSQPEYRALLAWLEAQKPNADVNAAIAVLDKVISALPNDVRSRWYRGQLYKRSGRDNRAIRDFRAIVEQDPRHVDAQREIRLYEMRHTGGSRPPSDRPSVTPPDRNSKPPPEDKSKGATGASGLFSRLFKR